ncbi:MAG: hypothetical protein ABSA47_08980 [Verrucomicrobiota bacterium]
MTSLLRIKFHDTLRVAGILWRENIARPGERPGRSGLYHTFNEWHFGDNLIHLNFLRRLAGVHPDCRFVHACRVEYHEQITPILWPLTNVSVVPLKDRDPHSVDAWKNHGAWSRRGGYMDKSPLEFDWVEFHLQFFADLARRIGLQTPIHSAEDLLFDYPALQRDTQLPGRWDFLVCNSSVFSAQLPGWKDRDWDDVMEWLMNKGHTVVCTKPSATGAVCTADHHLSVTGVGNVSMRVDGIIGCPSGPMWPTFNIWNRHTPRVLVHRTETFALGANTNHVRNKGELRQMMEKAGWI